MYACEFGCGFMSASYDQVAGHELEEHSPYCPPAFTPRSAPGVFAQYASHLPRSPMHRRCITCGFLAAFAKAAWSGLISATVVASTLAYAAGVFKTSVDSLADHVGSLALLALSLWYFTRCRYHNGLVTLATAWLSKHTH